MEEEDLELERLIAEMEAERDSEEETEEEEVKDEMEDNEEDSTEEDGEEDSEDEEEADDDESEQEESDDDSDGDESDEEDDELDEKEDSGFEPVTLDVNGTEVVVDNIKDLVAYAKKGANTVNKQETHVEEKLILEQGKLSSDDLKLLVDAKNGSKEAIAKLAQIAKVDTLDIEEDLANEYKPQFNVSKESEVDKVANEIAQDTALREQFQTVSRALPQDFTQKLMTDASMLKDFARHVKDGIAQEIVPKAITAQIRDGGTFIDAYIKVGTQLMQEKTAPEQQQEERQVDKKAQKLRDKATSRKKLKPKGKVDGDDIWALPQEEFEKALENGDIDLG